MDTLADRNNNPGNLRYAGQPGATEGQGGFAAFSDPEVGFSALERQLHLYASGESQAVTGPTRSVRGIISTYAPPSENDTEGYISTVSEALGVKDSDQLDFDNPEQVRNLALAIAKMEAGGNSAIYQQVADQKVDQPVPEQPESAVEAPSFETRPNTPMTPEMLSEAYKNVPEEATIREVIDAAMESEWVSHWAARAMEMEGIAPDFDFKLSEIDEETEAKLYNGIPEDFWSQYEDARSLNHALAIRKQMDSIMEMESILQSRGITGVSAQIIAAIFDPTAIAATIATEGALAPYIFAAKVTRGVRAVRAATMAAGTNAAIEGYLATQDPRRGALDILAAGGAGLVLGGAAGAITRGIPSKEMRELARLGQSLKDEAEVKAAQLSDPDVEGEVSGMAVPVERDDGEVDIVFQPNSRVGKVTMKTEEMEAKVRGILDDADDELSGEAAAAVRTFVGHEPRARDADHPGMGVFNTEPLEELHRTNPDVLESQFAPIREKIRAVIGDTVPLYRVQRTVDEGASERTLLSWTTDPKFAASNAEAHGKVRTPYTAKQIADAEAEFAATGRYQVTPKVWLEKSSFKGPDGEDVEYIAHMDDSVGGEVTDTDSVTSFLEGRNEAIEDTNARINERAKSVLYARVPLEDVVWATDRAGQMEFIVKNTPGTRYRVEPDGSHSSGRIEITPDGVRAFDADADEGGSTAGARQAQNVRTPLNSKAEDLYDEAMENPYEGLALDARFSMFAQLNRSKHPMISRAVSLLMPDGVGIGKDGKGQGFTAVENAIRNFQINMRPFAIEHENSFREWLKAQNAGWFGKWARRTEFSELVGRAVRGEPGTVTDDAFVNKVADVVRTQNAQFLKRAQELGLEGFEEVAENPQYLMRVHSWRKIDELGSKYGDAQVERLIRNSVLSHARKIGDDLSPEDAGKIAKIYWRRLRELGNGQDLSFVTMFSGAKRAQLADMLRTELGEGQEDVIERITGNLTNRPSEDGKVSRAKRRLGVDETYRMRLKDEYGMDTEETIGFDDLLENNAEVLYRTYARQMSGHFAMAEMGFAGKADFPRYIQHIRATLQNVNGLDTEGMNDAIKKLELLHRSVLGQPLHDFTTASKWLHRLRDFNFMRVMNQVGFSQVPEIGNVVGTMGLKAMYQQMPTFHRVIRRARDGHLPDELGDEIEAVFGIGMDRLLMQPNSRYDDSSVMEAPRLAKLDLFLQYGARMTADLSGMNAITAWSERIAAKGAIQNFANLAHGKKGFGKRRLSAMGINDDETLEAISRNIREHAGFTEGRITGKRVRTLNIENWDDETRRVFTNAIWRVVRRGVQRNDTGDLAQWMTADLGKMIIQFRTFATVSYEKQLLHGIAMRDYATFMAWSFSMMFGGLAYTVQTSLNAQGRGDKDEYLAERLTTENIAKAAFQKSGFSSLIPSGVDHVLDFAGLDPAFSYGRSTGLSAGILGNPSIDLLDSVQGAVKGGIASAVNPDYQFSQNDGRNALSSIFFQNMTGVRNMTNLMLQNLPETSR